MPPPMKIVETAGASGANTRAANSSSLIDVDVAGAAGSWLGAQFGGGIGVEIAVAATCRAERDVDVDAKWSERELGPCLLR